MSLPMATTTITVLRLPAAAETTDGYDPQQPRTTAISGLRAVIGGPGGSENITVGDRTIVTFTLNSDPFDYQPDDQIQDETNGALYELLWARSRYELGMAYSFGQLRQVTGAT